MMRALRWVLDYWWIPALILVGVGLSFLGPKMVNAILGRGDFREKLDLELGIIEAKREARDIKIQAGHDAAVKHVRIKYAKELDALDEREAARVKELEADPVKLAKAMARVAGRSQ